MSFVNIKGYGLEYSEAGKGEPLVLVHGSASDYRTWSLQQREFSNHFRTISYSRRYHFPNQPIKEGFDYSMAEHVDDLEKLLIKKNAVPANLVGHSYGAFLCLLLTIKAPEMVRSLVLAEPPVVTLFVSNNPKPFEILKLVFTRPRTAASIIKFGVKGINPAVKEFRRGNTESGIRLFGSTVFGKGWYDKLPEKRKQKILENKTNIKAELFGSGFLPVNDNEIRSIENPVLLINGAQSIKLFHRITDRLEELLPNVKRVVIPALHIKYMLITLLIIVKQSYRFYVIKS